MALPRQHTCNAVLAFLAAIAPTHASPVVLDFLYPRPKSRRSQSQSKRWAAAAQKAAEDLANHYIQGPHGNYHNSCWELHGQTNCPRQGDDLGDTFGVDTSADPTDPIVSSPSPTTSSASSPTTTTSLPTATTSTYTMDFDLKNIPAGWNNDPRSKLYSKPVIIGFSVSLAVIILLTIIACVIWKIRIARATQDLERRTRAKKTRALRSDDGDNDAEDDSNSQRSIRHQQRGGLRRRNRNAAQPPSEKQDEATAQQQLQPRWGRVWAKASERWRVNARLSAKRRKIGIVKIPPSTPNVEEKDDQPAEVRDVDNARLSTSEAQTRRPSLSASGRSSVDGRLPATTILPSRGLSPVPSPVSPSGLPPTSEPNESAGTLHSPTALTISDLAGPPPRLQPPAIILSPPPRSPLPEDPEESQVVSPPAYRRRGFSILSSAFSPRQSAAAAAASRSGKEILVEEDDSIPTEFASLGVTADPHTPVEDADQLPHQRFVYDLPMDDDDVADEETTDRMRLEATGHIATDEKNVLERMTVLRSEPSAPEGDSSREDATPLAPGLPDEELPPVLEEELSNDSTPTDSHALTLPTPPTLTKAHRIPLTLPYPTSPSHPPHDLPKSEEKRAIYYTTNGKWREGIGVSEPDWSVEPPTLAPSAPDAELDTEAPSAPSAPPLWDDQPSAPPGLDDTPLPQPPPASAPEDNDDIEYVPHDRS